MATVKMHEGWLVLDMLDSVGGDRWLFSAKEPGCVDNEVYDAVKGVSVHVDVVKIRILYVAVEKAEIGT